ncbi:MAG: hypothetical protein P8144_06500 [Gammaproteobacteria bacterium]
MELNGQRNVQGSAGEGVAGEQSDGVANLREPLPFFSSVSRLDVLQGVTVNLMDRGVGLAVLLGTVGVGKTRIFQYLYDHLRGAYLLENGAVSRQPECHSNGLFICLRPVTLKISDLIEVQSIADMARLIDRALESSCELEATSATCDAMDLSPDAVCHWVVLMVDDADQLPEAALEALIDHALMVRPQACLTVIGGEEALLDVARERLTCLSPLRRGLRVMTLPPFSISESTAFLRHAIEHWRLKDVDFSEGALGNLHRMASGIPDRLQDALLRCTTAPAGVGSESRVEGGFRYRVAVMLLAIGVLFSILLLFSGVDAAAFGQAQSEQPVDAVRHVHVEDYDYPQSVKRVLDWPESGYVVQLDADHDKLNLMARARQTHVLFERVLASATPLLTVNEPTEIVILPTSHLGQAWWVMIVGPYDTARLAEETIVVVAQNVAEQEGNLEKGWIRSVRDVQQAVLRTHRQALLSEFTH